MAKHLFAAAVTLVLVAGLAGCAQGPNSQARATEQGLQLAFGPAFFDYNTAELGVEGKEEVWRIARLLHQKPRAPVTIEGHTDAVGSSGYNLALSMARADAVKDALIRYGVDADRLSVAAMGEAVPVAYNSTEDGRAKNRRVEIVIR